MLKRMRKRVILAAMLAFFAVILLIATLVNAVNYVVVTGRLDETISYILNYEKGIHEVFNPDSAGSAPPSAPRRDFFMPLPDEESNYMVRFFIVRFDSAGNVVDVSTDYVASIDENEAEEYGRKVKDGRAAHGYMGEYRYSKENVGGKTVIIFLNAYRDRQFITDASHELKTPLTSISTSIEVISMEHGDDEWTDNIKAQTERMSKLVSELVALSRLDEEMPLPNKENFSLSSAAWEVAEVFRPQAKASGKNFTVDIEDDVTVYGEEAAVRQMLSVLLDNAIRYSDPNGDIQNDLQ